MRAVCARRPGFTLIELLVVIAIIAVLAAILLPLFLGARARTNTAACLSNLGQLGRAMRMYADDWNGFIPRCTSGQGNYAGVYNGTATGCVIRRGSLYRYVKNCSVFLCPSDRNVPAIQLPGTVEQQRNFPLSYTMNVKVELRNLDTMAMPGSSAPVLNHRVSKLCLLLHEGRKKITDSNYNPWNVDAGDAYLHEVHYDGTTLLYCDLHARWQSGLEILRAIQSGEFDPFSTPRY